MTDAHSTHLLRVLSTAFGVAVVVGGTIGQGIMRTPGLVAQGVPDATIMVLLWIAGGIIALIDAMSSVELAASIRRSGGPYVFAARAFGPSIGLAVGLTDWLGNVAAIAYIGVVFAEYLHRLGLATGVPTGLLAMTLPLATCIIHLFGTRVGGASQEIGSAVKAAVYAALILALLLAPHGAPVMTDHHPVALTLAGTIGAVRAVVGAYAGWNSAVYFTEEMKDPRRAIVRATFSGIAAILAVYVLMNIAILRTLTPAEMAGSNLVAAEAAARIFGSASGTASLLVTAVSLISVATLGNVMVMQFPRVLYAITADAKVPLLSTVAANGSPKAAVLLTAGLGALLATVGIYDLLLSFSLSLITAMSIGMNVAAIVMRVREPDLERPWRMPLFPLPALFSMLVNTALFAAFVYEEPRTSGWAFALLAVLTLIASWAARIARRSSHA
ncbi:APC family permease [Sphingomonas sp. AP4-R1]|uniref:APC family permease n=1 Tax=Sphingomonas sp. AP4-R1 TaxID=2735134 RepID=UPI001493428C|nr:APC family permease [Sphingomonas sp. AP4-R1]QJU58068.1 APC family permease [Sphingomonas sp. AP4-R1]